MLLLSEFEADADLWWFYHHSMQRRDKRHWAKLLLGDSAAPAHLWQGVSFPMHSASARLSQRGRISCRDRWRAGLMSRFRLCCPGSVLYLQGDLQRQLCSCLLHLRPQKQRAAPPVHLWSAHPHWQCELLL